VLIIDKEQENLDILRSRLETRGYAVEVCDSSVQAVRLIRHEAPDIILLDAQMEKVEGKELPRLIKASSHMRFIPIIMIAKRDHIAEQIMGIHSGFDDIMFEPFSPLELQLRIELNLKRAVETIQANPLTKLPGNIAIERKIKERIASGERFSVCYIDIDNFKSFNDKYGFDRRDDVIVQTARIILHAVQNFSESGAFVGHVGGDDFVIALNPDYEERIARQCIEEFDRLIPTHYSKEDQASGTIVVKNRRGEEEMFPIMSISIAAVTNLYRSFVSTGDIAQTAAEVKKYLKTQKGSVYLRDRREMPVDTLNGTPHVWHGKAIDKEKSEPLGQILLAAGLISPTQLQEALKRHFETGQRLGRVLIQMKAVSSEKIGAMLEKKLGIPYVSLRHVSLSARLHHLFTAEYIKTHGVVPVRLEEARLEVAMIDPYDLSVIDDIERITGLKVFPCIALEEEFADFVETNFTGE